MQDLSLYHGFNLCHQGLNDIEIMQEIGISYHTLCPDMKYISPTMDRTQRMETDRIVVGFISSYMSDHSIGKILIETILFLSINHPNIDVVVFFIDHDLENSPSSRRKDYITTTLREQLGPSRMLHIPDNVNDIRDSIERFRPNLDITVFTDVGMDVLSFFLASSRLSRYQVRVYPLSNTIYMSCAHFYCLV